MIINSLPEMARGMCQACSKGKNPFQKFNNIHAVNLQSRGIKMAPQGSVSVFLGYFWGNYFRHLSPLFQASSKQS